MKHIFYVLILLSPIIGYTQKHSVEKLWETDSIVAIPESVLPDLKKNILYVSLINGGPWEADGKGGIGRLNTDGTGFDSTWVSGLNAPKGMGLYENKLYVADISEVVAIDVTNGKILNKIAIDSAQGLNDITISDNGVVYVSDSKTSKIWRIEKDKPSLFLADMNGVNGLRAVKKELIIASGKSFIKADPDKKITPIAELPQGGDGVEPIGNGDFLVSAWAGYIFYVSANGDIQTLLDTHEAKRNTADIGYDAVKKIIYVPTFFAKTVAAYKLN
ncbi:MAG: ATP-binding protein [Ginsengibacter sp.]